MYSLNLNRMQLIGNIQIVFIKGIPGRGNLKDGYDTKDVVDIFIVYIAYVKKT